MYICVVDREGKVLVHKNIKNNDLAQFARAGTRKIIDPPDIRTGQIQPYNSLR